MLGSVSLGVLRRAKRPVLIVKPGVTEPVKRSGRADAELHDARSEVV